MNFLIKRAGYWHFNRRVPTYISHLDPRPIVRASTKVRTAEDPRAVVATKIANRMNGELENYWRALSAGKGGEARILLREATKRARLLGLDYAPAAELAGRDVQEILQRVMIAKAGPQDPAAIAAVLGGIQAQASGIVLSNLFAEYRNHVEVEIGQKSPSQMRVWTHSRERALSNLIEVVGDKDISHLTNQDAQEFRRWWKDRIAEEGVQRDTANKDFQHIAVMLAKLSEQEELELAPYFVKLRFQGSDEGTGVPFDTEFVQDRLLATGALDDLNPEARRVLYVMTETGLRPSEIVNLQRSTIRLDAKVPHVSVQAIGREVKTKNALRDIPLVGVALKAMQAQPDGFPRYHDKAAGLSAVVNKFLTGANLRQTPAHTLYSLRHTFNDRIRTLKPSDEFMRMLMGHAIRHEKYGKGYQLRDVAAELEKIAFKAPATV